MIKDAMYYESKKEQMYQFFEDHIIIDGPIMLDSIHKVFPMFNKPLIVYLLWKEFDSDCLGYLE